MGLSAPGAQTYLRTESCPSLATLTLGPGLHLDLSEITVDIWVLLGGGSASVSLGYEPNSSEESVGCLFYAREQVRENQRSLRLGGWGSGEGTSCEVPEAGWHRLTMTTSGPGGLVTFYLDGIEVESLPLSGQSTLLGQHLWLGAASGTESGTPLAEVASVEVFERCLDAGEVFESGYAYLPEVAVSFNLSSIPLQTDGEAGSVTLLESASQKSWITGVRPSEGLEGFVDCGPASPARVPEGSDYTLEAWLCPAPPSSGEGEGSPPQSYQQILGRYKGPRKAYGPECYEWSLVGSSGSYYYALDPQLDSSSSALYIFSPPVTLGVPQHVAISYSQSAARATLYIDGVEAESLPIPPHNRPPGENSSILRIGASVSSLTGSTNGFQGGVMGARIWRSARTAVQIREDANVFPADDEFLLVDYDLTDASFPVELTGRAANPTLRPGSQSWQIVLTSASPSAAAPMTSTRSALETMRQTRRVLRSDPAGPLEESQRRFAKIDLDRALDAHAALRESRPELLPAWLERHESRLGLHLRGGGPGGEPLLLATDAYDDQQLYYSTVALACVSACTEALGAPIVDERAAAVAVLSSLSNTAVVNAVDYVIGPPANVTAETIWGVPCAMAREGRLEAVLNDGTKIGQVQRAALERTMKRNAPSDPQARTIKQRIANVVSQIVSLIAIAVQLNKDDSCLTLQMHQDKGEALSLRHRDKKLTYWTMLVDGGHRGAPRQSYDMVVGTHAHADHIGGILLLLEELKDAQFEDEPGGFNRIDRLIINQPPPGEHLAAETLAPEELRRLLRAAEAGELSEDELVVTARSLVAAIVKLAGELGIPVSATQQGTPFPGPVPDHLHVLAIGPKPSNLNWLNRNWNPQSRKSEVFNRASIMQSVTYAQESGEEVAILLTGDGWDKKVPEENPPDPQPANKYKQDIQPFVPRPHLSLLKVPHHGSRLSEDEYFYDAVTADIYLCSSWVGGLPSMDTVRRIIKSQITRGSPHLYRFYFVLIQRPAARAAQIRELQQVVDDPQFGISPGSLGRNYSVAYLRPSAGALSISWQYTGEINYPSVAEATEILPG